MDAIIPARSGSKRIINKNISMLGSHPLLAYSIIACKLSSKINRIFLSTDCPKIAKIGIKYGAEVPFLRPSEISKDSSSDYGFLKHAFDYLDCEHLALIRPTSPLRDPSFLDTVINNFVNNLSIRSSFTGLRSMCESSHSPYKMFKIENKNICQGFFKDYNGKKNYSNLPNQIFPKAYLPNGYIDIAFKETIERGEMFGDTIYCQISDSIIDIDNQIDLDIVNALIGTKYDLLSVHLDKI